MVGVYDKTSNLFCRYCKDDLGHPIKHELETGWESEFPNQLELTCKITGKSWTQ